MIRYRGFPVPSRTGQGFAGVWIDQNGPHDLPVLVGTAGLTWGTTEVFPGRRLPRPGNDALALALCAAVVDEPRARAAYKIFRHRHVDPLPADMPWAWTHAELAALVATIERDMAAGRRMVARAPAERPDFAREDGLGANGVPVRWDTDDSGAIIPSRDPDDPTWTPAPHRRGT